MDTAGNTATGDNRPPVYWEGDNLIIRASALGTSCLWELAAAGQGYEPGTLPASLLRAFAEGHALEPVAITRLTEEYGVMFLSHQQEGDWEITPGIIIRHHPDGIANLGSDFWFNTKHNRNLRYDHSHAPDLPPRTVVVEVKWLSDALWQKFVKHGMSHVIDEYPWQGSVMQCHHAMPLLWVGGNKGNPPDENGKREPCPDEGKLWFELHREPIIPPQALEAKAHLIREAVTGEDVVESGKPCGDPAHWPCRYQHLRPEPQEVHPGNAGQPDGKNVRVVTDELADQANRMVRQYIYSKGQADELSQVANRERDNILALGEGYDAIQTDQWYIPIYGGEQKYLDTQAMIEDGIDVNKYYKTKPKSRSLNKRNMKRMAVEDGTD